MVNSLNKFVASFNFGILGSKRIVFVPNSSFNLALLNLLKSQGYILSYSKKGSALALYYNFSYSRFKFFVPSAISKRFVPYDKLRSYSNSGRLFVIFTSFGYILSDFALINKIGGSVILEIKFYLIPLY